MKKLITITALLTLAFSAQARRDGDTNQAFKNTMAGFASESIEHSLELMVRQAPATAAQVVSTNVQILTQDDSIVVVGLADGSELTYNCLRFDEWSRGGTVHKKEVICRQ